MVAYEITLTDSIRIKYGNHDSKHPKGSLRVSKEGNSVQFSDMNRQSPNSILHVNFDGGDTLTIDGEAVTSSDETLEALGTDFFSRAAPGGGPSEPDPQVALNTAAIAQNKLIAEMDTLQGGETIAEAGEVHAYGGRRWISLSDDAEVPDPVSIAALEASSDFEEFTGSTSQPALSLASTCFAISLPDPARTDLNVFDWNTTAVNDIRAIDFHITTDPSSSIPLTELVVPLGETLAFQLKGPLFNTPTTFANIAGAVIEATNNNGVLSFNLVEQMFSGSAESLAAWPNITYDALNESNTNVGEFRQASADFLFTDVPVDLSQVANDVKKLQDAIVENPPTEGVRIWKQQITGLTNQADQDFEFTTGNLMGDYRLKKGNRTAGSGNVFVEVYSDENRTVQIAASTNNRSQTDANGEGDSDLLIENLSANTKYYLRFRGGGGTTNAAFIATIYYDQQQSLVSVSESNFANPAARLEITHNTLASELGVDLANLGIQVVADGVGILPMTSADYVQGGITAITANAANWARIGNNAPTDTNVGFENVPQGRYRYTFSIPEQEDNSTVAANDVADNDRPFPVVLVDGVVVKLHGDNTYIEHDDGSTSEYFSSGSIVVPEGGSVQLGFVIEGGQVEEFEFQNQVIETQNGADAIYGFFEIEKIDRPVVVPAVAQPTIQFNTAQSDFIFNSTTLEKIPNLEFDVVNGRRYKFKFALRIIEADAAADMRLQVTGPASEGVTSYQNIENAISRTPDWGLESLGIAVATIPLAANNSNADLHYAEGWLIANADGKVEISIRNNSGTNQQQVSKTSQQTILG